ncbi:MAG: peptidoglycan DD-metalloendopeptidase family protein [Clostridiales bacterium]|nr:peptidoglycan DD-metalloendopeptidase family protein [Clostridiales bacterium]
MNKKELDIRGWAYHARRVFWPVCAVMASQISKSMKRLFPSKGSIEREGLRLLLIGRHRAHTAQAAAPRHLKLGISIAAALAVTLCILTVTLTGSQVMAVTVNGQMVGYVNDEAEYTNLMQSAKAKISKENGNTELVIKENKIALAPTFVPGDEKKVAEKAVSEDKLVDTLISQNAVETNVYTLNVAGKEVGKFGSLTEVTDTLNSVKQEVSGDQNSQSDNKGAFQEDIAIQSQTEALGQADNLSDPQAVKDTLLAGGDQSAPLVHYETTGVETTTEPVDFKTTEQKDPDMAWGDRETAQAGVPGERTVTRNVTRVNGEVTAQEEISSEVTKEPVDEIVKVGTKLSQLGDTGDGKLGKPLASWTFSRGVSPSHTGDDLCAPEGSPIYAAEAGTVIFTGQFGGYGNLVKIDHGNGLQTWYGHCEGFNCAAGDTVARGQQIATVGDTGHATCFHLHFEVRVNGAVVEPMDYLQ